MYGCHTDTTPDSTCDTVADNTIYTDQPRKWRHFAVDTTNDVLYYGDYDMARDSMIFYASRDGGKVWIGRWRGGWWIRG